MSTVKAMGLPIKPYYELEYGAAYLGDCLDLMHFLPDGSVNLIVTSPPFALTRKKEYGNKNSDEYVEWFLHFAQEFRRLLADDGSFVLDLGGAYLPGYPVRSIYQFELLVRLCRDCGFFLASCEPWFIPVKICLTRIRFSTVCFTSLQAWICRL